MNSLENEEDYKKILEKVSLANDRIKFLHEEISEFANISVNRKNIQENLSDHR